MRTTRKATRALATLGAAAAILIVVAPAASAQEVTGGCHATVNGQTLDTLDIKHPLVVAAGDTVTLTGQIPGGASVGTSETRIVVEVVGDVPVTTETGTGSFWGGTVEVPDVLTKLAPGVYKVKGTATGTGWECTGSAYIKIEGGPLTAAAGVGAVAAVGGIAAAVGSRRPKQTQVFAQAANPSAAPDRNAGFAADVLVLVSFLLLALLVGFLGPSWVVM
jgi:hypothetical protein